MSWAHVQGTGSTSSSAGGTLTGTFGGNVTAGNLIVVGVSIYNQGVSSVSDNQSNTYTRAKQQVYSQGAAEIWYATARSTGSLTVTVTNNYDVLTIDEFSFGGTLALDGSAGSTGTSTTPGSGSLTVSGTDLVVAVGSYNTTGTWSAGGSYTLGFTRGTSGMEGAVEFQLNVTTAASPAFTYTASGAWACAGAAFAGGGSGGGAGGLVPSILIPYFEVPFAYLEE